MPWQIVFFSGKCLLYYCYFMLCTYVCTGTHTHTHTNTHTQTHTHTHRKYVSKDTGLRSFQYICTKLYHISILKIQHPDKSQILSMYTKQLTTRQIDLIKKSNFHYMSGYHTLRKIHCWRFLCENGILSSLGYLVNFINNELFSGQTFCCFTH